MSEITAVRKVELKKTPGVTGRADTYTEISNTLIVAVSFDNPLAQVLEGMLGLMQIPIKDLVEYPEETKPQPPAEPPPFHPGEPVEFTKEFYFADTRHHYERGAEVTVDLCEKDGEEWLVFIEGELSPVPASLLMYADEAQGPQLRTSDPGPAPFADGALVYYLPDPYGKISDVVEYCRPPMFEGQPWQVKLKGVEELVLPSAVELRDAPEPPGQRVPAFKIGDPVRWALSSTEEYLEEVIKMAHPSKEGEPRYYISGFDPPVLESELSPVEPDVDRPE